MSAPVHWLAQRNGELFPSPACGRPGLLGPITAATCPACIRLWQVQHQGHLPGLAPATPKPFREPIPAALRSALHVPKVKP
jgi:hypothetical protein